MRRYALVLGLVAAVTLPCVLVFLSMDEGDEPAPPDAPRPASETPAVKPPPAAVSRTSKPVVAPAPAQAPAATPPVLPLGHGRLLCRAEAPFGAATEIRLTVLWPTGEEIASASVGSPGEHTFQRLPHGVPLVVRASATGFLTGLCCDVEIPDGGLVQKPIRMLAAPSVVVRVQTPQDRSRWRDVQVEAISNGVVLDTARTSGDGEAKFSVPLAGRLRLRVSGGPFPEPREFVRDVWPTGDANPYLVVNEIAPPETVEIAVVDAEGRRASSVEVWLVGELSPRRSARTDGDGVVVFQGVDKSNVLTAIARSGSLVAGAPVGARTGSSERIHLYLAKPQPLTGDVVDEGGSVIVGAKVEVIVRPFDEVVVVTSDDTGRFETPPVPAGLADVVVRKDGFLDWRSDKAIAITRNAGGSVRARMKRVPTGRVFVRVRDEAGGAVEGATVVLHPARLTATTVADGTCRIDDVPAATEQTVFVRKRGHSARRDASSPRMVRIPAFRGVDAEIVLAKRGSDDPPPGKGSLGGVVLDPSLKPVVGAAVECGRVRGFTNADGSFRLDGLTTAAPEEPLELRILPGPGMLEPLRFYVDATDLAAAGIGEVKLRSRPFARLVLPQAPPLAVAPVRSDKKSKVWKVSPPTGPSSPAFWLASNHPDVLLGVRHDAFEPFACVSYDGTWMHLPPADDWRDDGRGEVFLACPSWRGLLTAAASWVLTPDGAVRLPLEFAHPNGRISVDVRDIGDSDFVRFDQVRCGTLFDPRSIHVPTGNEQAPRDPFASLTAFRTFTIEGFGRSQTIEDVAPGEWHVVGGRAEASVTVPGNDRVVLGR